MIIMLNETELEHVVAGASKVRGVVDHAHRTMANANQAIDNANATISQVSKALNDLLK